MRIKHRYLTFEKNEKLTKLLDKLDVKYKVTGNDSNSKTQLFELEFFLYEDNQNFLKTKEAIDKFRILSQIGTEYDDEDYKKANWFTINAGEFQYPQPEENFGYLQTTFNLDNYCPTCGIGKLQNNPFHLKQSPKQKNIQFCGLHWVFNVVFLRPEVKNILIREGITGISFLNPHLHKNGLAIDEISQMVIQTTLPEGLLTYNLKKVTCKYMNEEDVSLPEKWRNPNNASFCNRQKYNFPDRGGLTFNERIFSNALDVVQTYEWFGSGASAMRPIIVSKKFKQLIEKNDIRGLVFTPIFHNEIDIVRQSVNESSKINRSWKTLFKI